MDVTNNLMLCPNCLGNGYFKIRYNSDNKEKTTPRVDGGILIVRCNRCNGTGGINLKEENKNG